MSETEQTKVCPLCAETIKAAAKVCPWCRKSQRGWWSLTVYDLGGLATLLLFIGATFLTVSLLQSKRDFGLDRDKIRVLDLHFARDPNTTNMVAFGLVTNASGHSWAIDQFEIRYLDKKGKLLGFDNQTEDFTILPKSDHSFRLDLDSYASAPGYGGCDVRVLSASDPRATFQFGDD